MPNWTPKLLPYNLPWSTATVAIDRGKLYGNNWGAQLGISYSGNFNIKRR